MYHIKVPVNVVTLTPLVNQYDFVKLPYPVFSTEDFFNKFYNEDNYPKVAQKARCRVNLKRTLRAYKRHEAQLEGVPWTSEITLECSYLKDPKITDQKNHLNLMVVLAIVRQDNETRILFTDLKDYTLLNNYLLNNS